jgi:glutathione S-transferase
MKAETQYHCLLGVGVVGAALGWWLKSRCGGRPAQSHRLRVTYLDIKGYGEPTRLALFVGGLDFEDRRVSYEQVAAMRASGELSFGQVPMLEIDGVGHTQSNAILRWAGRHTGLYPAELQLRCDTVEEALSDIKQLFRPQWYGHILGRSPTTGETLVPMTEQQKASVTSLLDTDVLPAKFKQLDRLLGEADFFCGDTMTICDLSFYVLGTGLQDGTYVPGLSTGVMDGCPRLLALLKRIGGHPRVAEWNARH